MQPGGCFVGGGLWHPDAAALARLRASIDERPGRIRRVLMGEAFRRTFLPDARAKPKPKPKKGKARLTKPFLYASSFRLPSMIYIAARQYPRL